MSQTWTLVNNNVPSSINNIGCYRNGQTTVTNGQALIGLGYYGNTSLLYYSSNGGTTFNTTTTFPTYAVDPTPAFTYVNSSNKIVYTVYADGTNNIYVSRDGGQIFTTYLSIPGLIGNINCITCNVSANNIIVGSNNYTTSITSYLYVYSNSTWSQTTIPNISIKSRCLICSSTGQYIYSLCYSSGTGYIIISSSDYGNSFNLSGYTLPNGTRDTYAWLACSADGSIVYAVSNYGIYKSTNYASSWSVISGISGDFTCLETDSAGTNVIVCGPNIVYYTKNGGTTWSSYTLNYPFSVTISSDGLTMYAYCPYIASLYQFQYPAPMICFHESTKILTNQGYRSIRDLRKGDLIQTADHGFVPIEIIGRREIYHPANTEDRIKDQLYLCSRSKYPALFEDLILTGCHSILVKQFDSPEQRDQTERLLGDIYVTDNHYRLPACLDNRADVYDKPGDYTIYHFALENADYYMNYGVYANGLLVESCSRRFMHELAQMVLVD